MMTSASREKGEQLFRDMLGQEYADRLNQDVVNGKFGAYFADHSIEACFGTIWARPGLDLRSRSIATIAMVISLSDISGLRSHVMAGLRNGLTKTEIEEIVYQAIPYLGYPKTGIAVRALRELFDEIDAG